MHSGTLLPILEKYLPKEGKILEGGCGLAPGVCVLRKKGYDAEGIDYSKKTIDFVVNHYPNLPVRVGNVFDLDYPDNSVKSYISLGVVEHFEEGPQKILEEAYRVLDKRGILILSVPYFNPLRKLKSFFNIYSQKGEFYQYAFSLYEIKRYLKNTGFRAVDVVYYDGFKGLKDEMPVFGPMLKWLRGIVSGNKREETAKIEPSGEKISKEKYREFFLEVLKVVARSKLFCFCVGHMLIIVVRVKEVNNF